MLIHDADMGVVRGVGDILGSNDMKSTEPRYEITVWDITDGSILAKEWDASWTTVEEVYEQYEGEPWADVQVEELS